MRLLVLLTLWLALPVQANSSLEFSLHKLESQQAGPTVLVVGGIQGDEPGGFHAASLLVTDYTVHRGRLWVVPNLNFESIVRRSRGVNGDMNRKFASLRPDDPDYEAVERIKALIRSPEVDYVLNLHDGSGFYRERYLDRMHNPNRWGQSIIIDQERLEATSPYGGLGETARAVAQRVNRRLLDPEHSYRVHNTRTAEGDEEMAKSLTYFAITHGKPALGLEASKNLPTRERVYYHLQLIEALLGQLGIGLERDFALEPMAIKAQIESDIRVSLFDRRIFLDVAEARRHLNYFPLREGKIDYLGSNPLVALVPSGDRVRINYGNRRMTMLAPQFFDFDESIAQVSMDIDGEQREVPFGSVTRVAERFAVHPPEGYRVNVIGWTRNGVANEASQVIERGSISPRFSVDRAGKVYRVEVYRDDKFSGMVLVRFDDAEAGNLISRERGRPGADDKS